jgi:hypothetical protein
MDCTYCFILGFFIFGCTIVVFYLNIRLSFWLFLISLEALSVFSVYMLVLSTLGQRRMCVCARTCVCVQLSECVCACTTNVVAVYFSALLHLILDWIIGHGCYTLLLSNCVIKPDIFENWASFCVVYLTLYFWIPHRSRDDWWKKPIPDMVRLQ